MRPVRVTKRSKNCTVQYGTVENRVFAQTTQWHPRRPIEIPFGMVGGLRAVVISFKFHQHLLSGGYRAVRGRNFFLIFADMMLTTVMACSVDRHAWTMTYECQKMGRLVASFENS